MGFLDKAKKMAEQAQAKIDEAQKQFNEGQQQGQASGPAVEYDQHGRPIPQQPPETAAPPHGDPLGAESSVPPPAPAEPAPTPGVPPTGQGDAIISPPPAADPAPAPPGVPSTEGEDRNNPSYAPPKLSSGDPLAG